MDIQNNDRVAIVKRVMKDNNDHNNNNNNDDRELARFALKQKIKRKHH